MSKTVKLACGCGKVTGALEIHLKDAFHAKCLCCDCQNFAEHLGNEDKILDSFGGTEVFQTYPAYVTITEGEEHISCLRHVPKGLLRYYASCCNTPIGNMMNGYKMPFIGIPVVFMQFDSEEHKNESLGPIMMKAFGKYAKGDKSDDVHERFPLSFIPKILCFMAKGFVKKKHLPSPYFKGEHPISAPEILKNNG